VARLPPLDENSTAEERKARAKLVRKLQRQAAERKKAAAARRAASARSRSRQAQIASAKQDALEQREKEQAKRAREEQARLRLLAWSQRKKQITKLLDAKVLKALLEDCPESLGALWQRSGLISPSGPGEYSISAVENQLPELRDALLELVEHRRLKDSDFWDVLDARFEEIEEARREAAQREQEEYEAEQRRKLAALNDTADGDGSDAGSGESGGISDDEWAAELAAQEAAKKAKKAAAKQAKQTKAQTKKASNETAKQTKARGGKKERRRG